MDSSVNLSGIPHHEVLHACPPAGKLHNLDLPVLLIVDDEPLIADSLAAIFRRRGFNAVTAYNGSDALQLAIELAPELLITDVVMPGMNGVELAIKIAGAVPACQILLFSAQATTSDLAPAYRQGYDFPLLAKPVHPDHMLARALECLEGFNALNS